MKDNIIAEKSFRFSIRIIRLYKKLIQKKEFTISRQLLRAATSIGANVEEALAASSKRDFLYKMTIASKESRETKYWLRLLHESNYTEDDISEYLPEADDLINILTKIVMTTTRNMESDAN